MTHLKPIAVLALILAATLEMRGPITAVGPLAGRLTSELGLSASEYGLAAALPVAAFGLFSFAAPDAARRFGLYGAVIVFLGVLAAGGFVRTAPSYPALLLGTLLIGVGIAALNVLMPVVVKTQNEAKTGALLGIYTGVVGLSGSIGALTSHPLAALTDFTQSAFLAWAAFGAVVLALWLAAFGRAPPPRSFAPHPSGAIPAHGPSRPSWDCSRSSYIQSPRGSRPISRHRASAPTPQALPSPSISSRASPPPSSPIAS